MLPELYHAHHSRYTEDLAFWLALSAQMGGPVLELGCGTGRVLMALAQAGYHCIGIDNDLSMLEFLGTRIGKLMPRPWFIATDITQFNLSAQFSLIILPCNTYSTLRKNERLACLGCVHKHLKPGGIFAVSIPNPETLADLPGRSAPQLEDEFLHPQTGNPVQVSSSWQRTKDTFQMTWIYDHLLPDGRVERFTARSIQQVLPAKRYLDEIRGSDLEVIGVYGDFGCSPYEENSPYMICVAKL
jgi:SAM-dependent methyltransferase